MRVYFEDGQPKLEVEIEGLYQRTTISAVIDTGFTGDLMLSLAAATKIGLILRRVTLMERADGTPVNAYSFEGGHVILDQEPKPVDILVTDAESLVGTGLLRHYKLMLDFHHQKINMTSV